MEEREQLARIDKALAEVDVALALAALERGQLRQLQTVDLDIKRRNDSLEIWRVFAVALAGLGAWSAFLVFLLGHWWR
jgi:hypothetical protein